MSIPSWAQQSVRLNEVEGVTLGPARPPHSSLMNITSVAKYLQTLTKHLCSAHYHCRCHLSQRRLRRKLFGIHRWDSGFPTARTPCIVCSPVTLWPKAIRQGHCTSPCDRVSLLSYLVIEIKQQRHSVLLDHSSLLISVSIWQPSFLTMWGSPPIVSECWLETTLCSTVLVRPLTTEESTSHGIFHGGE